MATPLFELRSLFDALDDERQRQGLTWAALAAAWHAEDDPDTPIEPWAENPAIELRRIPGSEHHSTADTWRAALGWAHTLIN